MQFKVSAKSDPRKVATAIISTLAETPSVTLNAIGAAAVNQAVKSAAIAGKHAKHKITCLPKFVDSEINGRICTILQIEIKRAA